jgi:hypothetical protein
MCCPSSGCTGENDTGEPGSTLLATMPVKGCSRIDSIVLGQYAVYNNLEERKGNGPVSVVKRYGGLSAEGGVFPSVLLST